MYATTSALTRLDTDKVNLPLNHPFPLSWYAVVFATNVCLRVYPSIFDCFCLFLSFSYLTTSSLLRQAQAIAADPCLAQGVGAGYTEDAAVRSESPRPPTSPPPPAPPRNPSPVPRASSSGANGSPRTPKEKPSSPPRAVSFNVPEKETAEAVIGESVEHAQEEIIERKLHETRQREILNQKTTTGVLFGGPVRRVSAKEPSNKAMAMGSFSAYVAEAAKKRNTEAKKRNTLPAFISMSDDKGKAPAMQSAVQDGEFVAYASLKSDNLPSFVDPSKKEVMYFPFASIRKLNCCDVSSFFVFFAAISRSRYVSKALPYVQGGICLTEGMEAEEVEARHGVILNSIFFFDFCHFSF